MTTDLSPADRAKQAAAHEAAALVTDGMTLGLGTGSTAAFLVRRLGQRVRDEGLSIRGVPTSARTAELAREEGIDVIALDAAGRLDLTIDGADEADPDFSLIKGGGGALLQEKIVASASRRMVVIADAGKAVDTLGRFPLPVEVVRFGREATRAHIADVLARADVGGRGITLREHEGAAYVTDEGHHILDLHLARIGNPEALATALLHVPGVVETGLFVGLCDTVILGHADGSTETRGQD